MKNLSANAKKFYNKVLKNSAFIYVFRIKNRAKNFIALKKIVNRDSFWEV